MGKLLWLLAAVVAVAAAPPAVAHDGGDYACDYCELFPYKQFRLQIEGGHTITQGFAAKYLDNGMNLGLGLTWQPNSGWPLALRADGVYQSFEARQPLLTQA